MFICYSMLPKSKVYFEKKKGKFKDTAKHWGHMSLAPTLRMQRWEDQEFKVISARQRTPNQPQIHEPCLKKNPIKKMRTEEH